MRALIRSLLLLAAVLLAPAALAQQKAEAVFAGGCFWCMETDMKAIPGVLDVMSGYTGGQVKNPNYKIVSMGVSGHYEAVKVTYDASKITYDQLLTRYWKLVDPTDDGGQFCDRGLNYRPAIFATPEQKPIAEASKQKLIDSRKIKGRIIVPILPLSDFYPAEAEHRNYAARNPEAYADYRQGCGRDEVLKKVWGIS